VRNSWRGPFRAVAPLQLVLLITSLARATAADLHKFGATLISVARERKVAWIRRVKREATSGIIESMSARHHSNRQQDAMSEIGPGDHHRMVIDTLFVDPREFGLTKVAYSVGEVLEQLSIGRTSLYAAIKRRELTPVKFGRKTLFYAADLAAFLARLRQTRPQIKPTVHDP
jgi:excisionase family DNA binding protein